MSFTVKGLWEEEGKAYTEGNLCGQDQEQEALYSRVKHPQVPSSTGLTNSQSLLHRYLGDKVVQQRALVGQAGETAPPTGGALPNIAVR